MPRGRMCTGGLAGTSCAHEAAGCQRPWPRPAARSRPVSGRGLSLEVGVRLPLACPLTRTRVCTFGLPLPLCVWRPFPLRTPVRTESGYVHGRALGAIRPPKHRRIRLLSGETHPKE